MKKEFPSLNSIYVILFVIKTFLMLETIMGDPPSQIVQVTCGDQLVQNTTALV